MGQENDLTHLLCDTAATLWFYRSVFGGKFLEIIKYCEHEDGRQDGNGAGYLLGQENYNSILMSPFGLTDLLCRGKF